MKKKHTAADRPEFRRNVTKALMDAKAVVAELAPDMCIVCLRAEDFDPADNVLWELPANKSSVREGVVCSFCGYTVAMSNHAFARYSSFDRKPKVCCTQCIVAQSTIPDVLRPR